MKNQKLMSVKDYAIEKGQTVQAIYKQVKEGRVKSVKLGSVILIVKEN
jgi:hypothetical protein